MFLNAIVLLEQETGRGYMIYVAIVAAALILMYLIEKLLWKLLERWKESDRLLEETTCALHRVTEWMVKYPDVSFRHSRHARMLLVRLYQAEKRYAAFCRFRKMNPKIVNLISELLETDPDDDLPPSETSLIPGSFLRYGSCPNYIYR